MKGIFNKGFISIFIIAFLLYLCMNMTQPILPRYLQTFDTSIVVIGFISSLFAIVAVSLRPISGQIVDNEDKKIILIFSSFLVMVSMIGYYFSINTLMIGIFRGLHGFAWAFGSTVCMTIAINSLPKDSLNEGVGIYGLGQIIAAAIAPSLGIFLADTVGYHFLFLTSSVCAVIAFIISLSISIKGSNVRKSYNLNINNIIAKEAILPSSLTLCNQLIYGALATFIIIYGESIGVYEISFFFTIYSITIIMSRFLLTSISRVVGEKMVTILCEFFIVCGIICIFFASSSFLFNVAAVLIGIGFSGCQPLLMAQSVKCVSSLRRGVASSTNYIGTDIGMIIGSFGSGLIVNIIGYRNMFILTLIPLLLMLFVYGKTFGK